MKTYRLLLSIFLLSFCSFAQTHTAATQEDSNTFTGSNTFGTLNSIITLDGTQYPQTTTGFQNAVNAAVSGQEIDVPANVTITLTSSINVASKNLVIHCQNRNTSIINGPAGSLQFNLSGTITYFVIDNCQLGSALGVLNTTGVSSQDGRWTISRNWIQHMTGAAITAGASTYYWTISANQFGFNVGDILDAANSDMNIYDNAFEYPNGTAAHITTQGANVHIFHNTFIWGNAGNNGTGPDILFQPKTATYTSSGRNWVSENKFGVEGEQANRYKIQVSGDAATFMGPTYILGNDINCLTGTNTAVRLDSEIHSWLFSQNTFNNCGTLIADVFTPVSADYGYGSVFDSTNKTLDPGGNGSPMQLFTNGGRGFSVVAPPSLMSDTPPFGYTVRNNETTQLNNRIQFSEDLTQVGTWVRSGISSVTCGQSDPFGTTRSCTVTRNGSATFENISDAFDVSSLPKQLYVKFWAKAGTTTLLESKLFDYTAGVEAPDSKSMFTLSSGWKQFEYATGGINTGDGYALYFYPNGESQRTGSVTICCVQVSDQDSDYIPTTGSSVTNGAGNRQERPQIQANSEQYQENSSGPSGASGFDIVYGDSGDHFWKYNSNNGGEQHVPQAIILSSAYTNSTTGFTTVTGISFAVKANTKYIVDCHLYYQAASTGGLNIQFTGPASPTNLRYAINEPLSASTTNTATASAFSTSLGAAVTTANTDFDAAVTLGLVNGANAGTVTLQAKSSAAVNLTVQPGSYCQIQ